MSSDLSKLRRRRRAARAGTIRRRPANIVKLSSSAVPVEIVRPDGSGARRFLSSLSEIVDNVEVSMPAGPAPFVSGLDRAVQAIVKAGARGRKLMIVGNGGSAAIAGHMALDCWNACGIAATAFNDVAQLTCMSNDRGYENVFAEPVRRSARMGDILVAISSSGRSPNILNAVSAAKEKGCETITLSGFAPDNPLRAAGALNFYVPSPVYSIVELIHHSILAAILQEIMSSKTRMID